MDMSLQALTAALEDIPHVPTLLGDSGLFEYAGVTTTYIEVERENNTLSLVQTSARGVSGKPIGRNLRNLRKLDTVHIQLNDAIYADEVQNVRQFGTQNTPEPLEMRVTAVMTKGRQRIDLTLENHRVGALKGIVYDADGTTPLLNLFTEFGVAQNTLSFDLGTATTDVRSKCDTAENMLVDELQGLSYTGREAWVGRNFWQALVAHKSVRDTFLNQPQSGLLRQGMGTVLDFGGILWRKYNGPVQMIGADEAYIVPRGVPGLFLGRFAPGDYADTVNTMGLPMYAVGELLDKGKGWDVEMQSNPIHLCTRPRAVIKATIA